MQRASSGAWREEVAEKLRILSVTIYGSSSLSQYPGGRMEAGRNMFVEAIGFPGLKE